jgi:hypothetical protein
MLLYPLGILHMCIYVHDGILSYAPLQQSALILLVNPKDFLYSQCSSCFFPFDTLMSAARVKFKWLLL